MISKAPNQLSEDHNRATGFVLPLLFILLLLLATGLRFHKLDAQSFWNDEGNSARLSERSLPLIIEGTASDVHPPLYYLFLRGWRELLGDSEFGLRSFSAFAGVLTVAAVIALARFFFPSSRWSTASAIVVLAGLLAALNPTLVYYSQETRMYALLALLAALSTVVLLRWLEAGRRWPWALAYVLFSTAGLYTHYFYPTVFVFQGLVVLLWVLRRRATLEFAPQQVTAVPHWTRVLLAWLIMVGFSFVLYFPWVPIFLRQTTGRAAERAAIPLFLWDSIRWMVFGETIAGNDLIWITVIVILLLVWAIVASGRRIMVPFLGVLVPLVAMFFAGTTNPAFFKFMIIAIPFLLIWLAGSLGGSERAGPSAKRFLRVVTLVLLVPVLGGMLLSLQSLYNDSAFARADYRAMAAAIAAAEDSDAGIILNAPNQWEVFTYYHQEGAPVYPLPKGQPDPQILEPQLAEIADRHDRLYALYWGDEQRDPQHVVENWLDKNTFKASETWVGDVRFVTYATSDELAEQQSLLNTNFDDKITLHGFAISGDVFAPGDIIPIRLFWSAERSQDKRYKVFLHLVDAKGTIAAQQDSEPVGGMSPTTTWQPGDIVVDNQGVSLPDDLPQGEYDLLVGLYELNDPGARLNIRISDEVQDHFVFATIVVEE